MLVDHISMEEAQQTPLPRAGRKRRARGGDISGAGERAKTSRRQLPPAARITKPEPDEDSGLGFDDPHEPLGGAAETACLLRTGLVPTVRRAARREDTADSGFVRDVRSTSDVHPPPAFLKGVNPVSKCGKYRLVLTREPESRHRARYQTEGSRGAVKDATGKTSPQVVLYGCTEPVALQMFVGSDADGCSPHLFYQSCRVTGKTASPSDELVLNGTVVIQTTMTPEKDGTSVSARCDCLGILKQRNVDIESRVAAAGGAATTAAASASRRSANLRKGARTTSCRLVFRVTILNGHGRAETLQIASRSIICTQPQGVPEVTKLSLSEASPAGGQELIVLGKNFVKDSRVVFTETAEGGATVWSESVTPHKDHLQAVHLVCDVPAYRESRLSSPRAVSLTVRSGDRESDTVPFTFVASAGSELSSPLDRSDHSSGDNHLPNGVSEAAIAINRHFAETGKIVLGNSAQPTEQPAEQPTAALTELTKPTTTVAAQSQSMDTTGDKPEELSTLLVPVVTASGQSQNMFVTVTLPSAVAEAAPILQEVPSTAQNVWPQQQQKKQKTVEVDGWSAVPQPETTVQATWSPGAESTVQKMWSSSQPETTSKGKWSPPQPEVTAQTLWSSSVSETAIQGTAWSSPQAEATVAQDTWSPATADTPAETAWPSSHAETPAQNTWSSPAADTRSDSAWSSPQPATPAQNVWSPPAPEAAGQHSTWSQATKTSVDAAADAWEQKAKAVVAEPVHSWTPAETAEPWSMEMETEPATAATTWPGLPETKVVLTQDWPSAESETQRNWSTEAASKLSSAPLADWAGVTETKAAAAEPWAPLADVKAWPEKADAAETVPSPAWTAPASSKTWPPGQHQTELHDQQRQHQQTWSAEAAEVRSWSQEQLADVLQEDATRPPVPEPAASAPSPSPQAGRSDPMWSEAPFTAPATAADDPLSLLPKGMGLIEYINGDNV